MYMEITLAKVDKYLQLTEKALGMIKIDTKKVVDAKKTADDFLDMAQRYFSDAKHFKEKGDLVTAFAAINYAHAWLDAGARLGVFDVHDTNLFAAD